jgi:hypothetical protein
LVIVAKEDHIVHPELQRALAKRMNATVAEAKSSGGFQSTKVRSVYLPAGTTWYDFWTGAHLTGGQVISVEAELANTVEAT